MHVMVTALAKENSDDNGNTEYWPMIDGKASMQQLPGIFDCVFAGIRSTSGNKADGQKVVRYIVTDEVRGWKGKVRDEKRRLRPWEQTGSVVDLFKRMDMSDADFAKLKESETETSEEQENQ